MNNYLKIGILIFFIAWIATFPMLKFHHFFMQDDYMFHIARLENYTDSIKHKVLFPKVFSKMVNGGGYGTDIFYPSIFLLPYSLFRLIGVTPYNSFKIFLFLINLLTAFNSVVLAKEIFKKRGLVVLFCVLYCLSSYKFIDQVQRGALGETLALAFLPLTILGIYSIFFGDQKKWYTLPIGMSCTITVHLLSAYIIFFFIIIIWILASLLDKNMFDFKKKTKLLLLSGCLSFLFSSWQILPILEQILHMEFTFNETQLFVENIMSTKQLILNSFSPVYFDHYGLDPILILFLLVSPFFFFRLSIKEKILLILGECFTFGTTSLFPWKFFSHSPIKMIQFPFRLLFLATLLTALLTCVIVKLISQNSKQLNLLVGILFAFGCIFWGISSIDFHATELQVNLLEHANSAPDSLGGGKEYIKKGDANKIIPKSLNDTESSFTGATYSIEKEDNGILKINSQSDTAYKLKTPLLYYYGYCAVDEHKQEINIYEKKGRVALRIPKGSHVISIYYKKTDIQKISALLSIISILAFLIHLALRRNKKRKQFNK